MRLSNADEALLRAHGVAFDAWTGRVYDEPEGRWVPAFVVLLRLRRGQP